MMKKIGWEKKWEINEVEDKRNGRFTTKGNSEESQQKQGRETRNTHQESAETYTKKRLFRLAQEQGTHQTGERTLRSTLQRVMRMRERQRATRHIWSDLTHRIKGSYWSQ